MMATIPIVLRRRDVIANKQRMSEVFRPIRLVCTICTGMFGNGAAINGMTIIMVHRLTEVLGKLEQIITECCVAVPGTAALRSIAALPSVSGIRRAIPSGASVFAWLRLLRSLRCFVLCCSLPRVSREDFSFNNVEIAK